MSTNIYRLFFPPWDWRSSGVSFNPRRPWLRQGAICRLRRVRGHGVLEVQFVEAPKGDYDLVSPEFAVKR